MNPKELIDEFIKFEYENDLFNKEINGVKFWHYIRFSIYNEILKQKYDIGQAHSNLSGKNYITRVWYKIKQIPDFIFKNPLYGLKQKDILVLNHHRRVKNDYYYDCIYTDEILKNIKRTYYVFEEPYLEKHFKPVRTSNLRYFDYINFLVTLKNKISKITNHYYGNFQKKELEDTTKLLKEINETFNTGIEDKYFIDTVKNTIVKYRISRKYYEKILEKVKPKVIIEVVSYGFSRLIINEIAEKMHIPTIELQHGVMGKYHIAYNFYKKIKLDTFPVYVFLFGEYWERNTRLPIDDSKAIITGFPYLEKKLYNCKNQNPKNNKTKNILFISQGTKGKELSKMAIKLDEIIDHEKYNIIYKLHPGEYDRWQIEYPWLENSDIQIIDKNEKDIYYYFLLANYLVGVNSTALYEGLAFGLRIFIFKDDYGYIYMEDLIKKNYAELILSADDIVKKINNGKENTSNIKNKKIFWHSNSLENIIHNFENVLNKRY
jgi:hypothetical protein